MEPTPKQREVATHPKAGDRYHKTRYFSLWPEDACLSILDQLEALDGRIKTVKYIDPGDQEESRRRDDL